MTTVYVGQIEIFAFNFPPKGWALCNGQLLSIQQNAALFSLLGTYYGGNGTTNFALPDLRSRVPLGVGPAYVQGQAAGEESHQLLYSEMPQHNHSLMADAATAATSNGKTPSTTTVLGKTAGAITDPTGTFTVQIYSNAASNNTLASQSIGNSGNSGNGAPHENRMPFLALNFCISLTGVFPSRN